MNSELLIPLLAAAVVSGTPILYATLGEIITEKAGVLNLGVEGVMMMGCFCAFITAQLTGQPWLAFWQPAWQASAPPPSTVWSA